METKRYLVRYAEEENPLNVKTFGVKAYDKRNATHIVTQFIEQNKLHPSINIGFYLYAKISDQKADYELELDEFATLKKLVSELPDEFKKKGENFLKAFKKGKESYISVFVDIASLTNKH